MSELLEFLVESVLELVFSGLDCWAGWRFFLPFLGSVAIDILINSLGSTPIWLSVLVVLAGLGAGIVWQVHGDQQP